MVNEYLLSAIIMLLGNIVATIFPYLRKQYKAAQAGGKIEFDLKYLYNAVAAALVQFILVLPAVGSINVDGALDIIGLIIMSFAYGYGGNKAQIEGGKLYSVWKAIRAVSSAGQTSDTPSET